MISLQLLQESFMERLINPDKHNKFLDDLIFSGKLSPEQQLAIYQSNMNSALQKTMAQIYPVSHRIVGSMFFKHLVRNYISEQPSEDPDLNAYGKKFSNFIQTQYQHRHELISFPYLCDLVQLEWFYHSIYYAAEGSIFDLSAFTQLTTEQQESCIFILAPQLKFIASNYPILSIWRLNQKNKSQQHLGHANAENCCVFREYNNLQIHNINDSILRLLSRIKAGLTLAEIAQTESANYLPKFIKSGWVVGFKIHHVQ